MTISPGSHEIARPPISDERREAMFKRLYGELDAYALQLGGPAWNHDDVFSVGIERTRKISTSKLGIFNPGCYYIETVGFSAEKFECPDPDDPFFSVFRLTRTVSRPMDVAKADPQHHERLFDHLLEFFPGLMKQVINSVAGPVNRNVLTDEDETDLDDISPDARFGMSCRVLTDGGIEFRLAKTMSYTVIEQGQALEFAEDRSYEIGGTILPLVCFDSEDVGKKTIHSPAMDKLAVEKVDEREIPLTIPQEEKIPNDIGEAALIASSFNSVMEHEFNSEDHGAIPYHVHVARIRRMLAKLVGTAS